MEDDKLSDVVPSNIVSRQVVSSSHRCATMFEQAVLGE